MKRLFHGPFRNQLFTLTLIAALPAFGLLTWHLTREWERAVEAAQLRTRIVSESVTRDLWGIFRDFRDVVGEIARRPQLRTLDPGRCDPLLREYATIHAEIAAITVRNLNGVVVCSSLAIPATSLPAGQMALINNTVRAGMLLISGVEWGPSSKKWVVGLTFPVRNQHDEIAGVLFLTLDLSKYGDRILTGLPDGTSVTVLARDFKVAMTSAGDALRVGASSPNAELLKEAAATGTSFLTYGGKGDEQIAARVVEPLSGWTIVSSVAKDDVLAPQARELRWSLFIGAGISLLFLGVLAKTAMGISEPLAALARTARRVALGDFNTRADEVGSEDVREVAHQFNRMLDVVEQRRVQAENAARAAEVSAQRLTRFEEVGAAGGFYWKPRSETFILTDGCRRILDLSPMPPETPVKYEESLHFLNTELREAIDSASRGASWYFETQIETATGRKRWIITRGEPDFHNGEIVGVFGYIRDITEIKDAETRAEAFAAIVENSDDAIAGMTLAGVLTSWNPGATVLYGYTEEEMIGQSVERLIPPERAAEEDDILRRLAAGESVRHFETTRTAKDGRRIDVSLTISPIRDAQGAIIGASKIARDITAQKQKDRLLLGLIEAASTPYGVSDENRNIVYVNKAFTTVFGYELEDVRAFTQWRSKMFPDPARLAQFERHRAEYTSDFKAGTVAPPFELEVVAKDGTLRHTIATMAKLDDTSIGARILSLQDVSQLKATQTHLREAQKLEAIGRLASGIAHDFNNLLGIISASAELMLDQKSREQDTATSSSLILRACERGADLIRRLLIFSRKSNSSPVAIKVSGIVDDLVSVLRRTLGSRVEIKTIDTCRDAHIFADTTLFYTALYNLATNARDAMPAGGTLTISVDRERGSIGGARSGDVVVISMTDTGEGMPQHVMQHIFDPFFTTKSAGKGTGLGLSMVYGFVTEAKGEISVESTPQKGTTFRLRFPESPALTTTETAIGNKPTPYVAKSRILLVEDDPDLREAVKLQLQSLELQATAAASGTEAVRILELDQTYDLLITDYQLGNGMTGAELARAAERIAPGIRVVLTSGYLSPQDISVMDPRWPILQKPVTKDELRDALMTHRTGRG